MLSHQEKDESERTAGFFAWLFRLFFDPQTIEEYELKFWLRKLAHFTEYFILNIFMYRVIRIYKLQTAGRWIAWALCVVYAISDEFHQTFITGRTGSFMDVCIDGLGAGFSLLMLYLLSEEILLKKLLPLHKQNRSDYDS